MKGLFYENHKNHFNPVGSNFHISSCKANQRRKNCKHLLIITWQSSNLLDKEMNLAYWNAANSGKDEDYQKVSRLELTLRKIYSDANEFSIHSRNKGFRPDKK